MSMLKEKKYNLLQNIFYVYKGVARHKPYLILLLFVSMISNVGSRFIWLYLSKYLIEYISEGMAAERMVTLVLSLTAANILCMLGQNAVNFGKDPAALYVRPMFMLERNKKHIRLFYEKLEYREVLDWIERSRRATSWTEKGIEGVIRFTLVLCSDLFTCVAAVIILCRVSIYMVFAVAGFGMLSYWSIDRASKREKELTNDSVAPELRKKQYFNRISRDFSFGKDIRLYHVQPKLMRTQRELEELLHKNVCAARNVWLKSGVFTATLELLREWMMYLGLVTSILQGRLEISDFTLYVGCVRHFAQTFHNVMSVYARMRQCSREVNDYRTVNEYIDEQEISGSEVRQEPDYEIRFDHVSFAYPGTDKYSLKNMNLTITPGQKLAIVGVNGAGKTTFIKLLLRLYEPTEGTIFLNGVDIRTYSTESYYRLFAPVFQDMECYAFSLAENVSMKGGENTDRERAEQALRDAGLGNRLDEWERGIDTPVLKILHDDGVLLSGGERQKLALARALYKDAPMVILDEPTAALDAMAESKMYEDFDRMVAGKTAVYISHRLASTRFCDVTALFHEGELAEYGTHDELMEKNGRYAELFRMQAQYYDPAEKPQEVRYETMQG